MQEENDVFTESIRKYFKEVQWRLQQFDDMRREMNVYLAQDFNVFDYIRPDENRLSDIFADLLNPLGTHGQSAAFLQAFLACAGLDFCWDKKFVQIERESATSYIANPLRRMDITLNFANRFILCIENKPWAQEQEKQLEDYRENMQRQCGEKYCLIYLIGDGSEPLSLQPEMKKAMLENKQLIIMDYAGAVQSWLQECMRCCQAEKIKFFIKDLSLYIEKNFAMDDRKDEKNEL